MDRRSVAIVGVVVAVTAASWAASIAYDAEQLEIDSYERGREWAELYQPSQAECEAEMFQVMGPEVNGRTWLEGCVSTLPEMRS